MRQPEGHILVRQDGMVCLPRKSLYGLEPSPRQGYMEFDSVMIGTENSKCKYERCVYFKKEKDPTYLLWYVDHMPIVARSKSQVQKGKAQLERDFDMKGLGDAKTISGIEITQDSII